MRYTANVVHVGGVYDNHPSLGVAAGHAVAFCRGPDDEAKKLAQRIADALNGDRDEVTLAAMCLWEEVSTNRGPMGDSVPWYDDLECEGTCAVRDRVLALAPQCDADWRHAQEHMGFDDSFDWEFAPQWLRYNYGKGLKTPEARLAWLHPEGSMTFDEFAASGRDVDDLAASPHDLCVDGPGRVYCYDGGPYIQRTATGWHLHIAQAEYAGPLSELEPILYRWAVGEGFSVKAEG